MTADQDASGHRSTGIVFLRKRVYRPGKCLASLMPGHDVQLASRDGVHSYVAPLSGRVGPASRLAVHRQRPCRQLGSLQSLPATRHRWRRAAYYGGRTYRHVRGKRVRPAGRLHRLLTITTALLSSPFDGARSSRNRSLKGSCLHLNAWSDFGEINVEASSTALDRQIEAIHRQLRYVDRGGRRHQWPSGLHHPEERMPYAI